MSALSTQIGTIAGATFNGSGVFAAKTFGVEAGTGTVTVALTTVAAPATTALTDIQAAIATISTARGTLGASQSQLNYIGTAQQNLAENLSAVESRIRDVDVAKESTNFAKNQILVQASTAMLAQANANSQNVLSLLK
jgi:flagellin